MFCLHHQISKKISDAFASIQEREGLLVQTCVPTSFLHASTSNFEVATHTKPKITSESAAVVGIKEGGAPPSLLMTRNLESILHYSRHLSLVDLGCLSNTTGVSMCSSCVGRRLLNMP